MKSMRMFVAIATVAVAFTGIASAFDSAEAARCRPGYVWRGAEDGDGVCVTPQERDDAVRQNQNAPNNRQPGGGAYGPRTCRQGYVWREAFPGDTVCVTPYERAQAQQQNVGSRGNEVRPLGKRF